MIYDRGGASLSHWGVERNKDSLSILNFTRKFFINSARRTGSSGQLPRWPRWASNLTGPMEATVYQHCSCCLPHSLSLSLALTYALHMRASFIFGSSCRCFCCRLLSLFTVVTICDLLFLFIFRFSVGLGVLDIQRGLWGLNGVLKQGEG